MQRLRRDPEHRPAPPRAMNLLIRLAAIAALATSVASAQGGPPPPPPDPEPDRYEHGVIFPKPTSAQLDTFLLQGIVPPVLENSNLRPMYWARSAFVVAARATHQLFMTQALDGGFGIEGNIGIPLGPTDHGLYLFARANAFRALDPTWLGWQMDRGQTGVMFNGGVGAAFAVPTRHPQFSIPLSLNFAMAFFQSRSDVPAETYASVDPSIGLRYRVTPALAVLGRAQGAWMVALRPSNRDIGAWNFSLGMEVALALQRQRPLQYWVPPLVVAAEDVVQLLASEIIPQVNIFDRNLDFINTELKPLTAFGWYDLGFHGTVRGTIIASSRASSGNVTALDIRLDSADRRGFRVNRLARIVNPDLASEHRETSSLTPADTAIGRDSAALARMRKGEYAYRPPGELGSRYLRVEVFPAAKGPLELIPKVGSRVSISGDIRWDGDGHIELHPRNIDGIKVYEGEFLDVDDPVGIE
jgi:hypothetical protein